MKMAEFLTLSDDERVKLMPDNIPGKEVTEDKGYCSVCGVEVTVDEFCFGCHQLICIDCAEKPGHQCF